MKKTYTTRPGRMPEGEMLEIAKAIVDENRDTEEVAAEHNISKTRAMKLAQSYHAGNNFERINNQKQTLYKPEYCDDARKFFTRVAYEELKTPKLDKSGKEVIYDENGEMVMEPMVDKRGKPVLKPQMMPTMEGLAIKFGVSSRTLANWALKYPDFADAMEDCKAMSKEHLNQNGLLGLYNPVYAKFFAINATDMRENINVSNKEDPFDAEDALSRRIKQIRKQNAENLTEDE